jgi:predicted dehydrogenase
MAMYDLKAAIIGTGGAARLHAQAYATCPHTQPVAVCSRTLERAQAFADEFRIRAYTSIPEMLETERPDVVSVATLEWDHEAPVLLSLEAGSHVLCEKIMAHTLAIAENMVAVASRAGRRLGVNYNYRVVPSHRILKQELDGGGFGAPALFSAHMHAYLWPHMLDLLRFFVGDPVEVTAALVDDQALRPSVSIASRKPWVYPADESNDPTPMLYHPSTAVSASLRFRNPDFLASMSASALVPLEDDFWSFALFGTRASVSIQQATRANLIGRPALGSIGEVLAGLPAYSYKDSFADSVASFVDSIREGKPAPVTGEDGLAALRLDAAIVKAIESGRAVSIPPSF